MRCGNLGVIGRALGPSTDPIEFLHRNHRDDSISRLSGVGNVEDRIGYRLDLVLWHRDLYFRMVAQSIARQVIRGATETLHLDERQSFDAYAYQPLFQRLRDVGADNGNDISEAHTSSSTLEC